MRTTGAGAHLGWVWDAAAACLCRIRASIFHSLIHSFSNQSATCNWRSSSRNLSYTKLSTSADDLDLSVCLWNKRHGSSCCTYSSDVRRAIHAYAELTQKELLNLTVQDNVDLLCDRISSIVTSSAATESLHFACNSRRIKSSPVLCQYSVASKIQYNLPLRTGKDTYGETLLMTAVRNEEFQSVEQYMEDAGLGFRGRSALMMAASAG